MRTRTVILVVFVLLLLVLAEKLVDELVVSNPEHDNQATNEAYSATTSSVDGKGISVGPTSVIQCLEIDSELGPLVASRQQQQAMAQVLALSSSAEHQLTAILMSTAAQSNDRIDGLVKLSRRFPYDPLVISGLLDACKVGYEDGSCDTQGFEQIAIQKLGSNGAIWARIAVARHYRGDVSGSLEALERANAAPEYNDYVTDTVVALDRSLAAAGDLGRAARFETALALAYNQLNDYGSAFDICLENIDSLPEWHSACMGHGRRLERDSSTIIAMAGGISLQRFVLGEGARHAEVEELEQRHYELQKNGFEFSDHWMAQQVYRQPAILNEYLVQLDVGGEILALRVFADAERRILEACQ